MTIRIGFDKISTGHDEIKLNVTFATKSKQRDKVKHYKSITLSAMIENIVNMEQMVA